MGCTKGSERIALPRKVLKEDVWCVRDARHDITAEMLLELRRLVAGSHQKASGFSGAQIGGVSGSRGLTV